MWRLIAPVLALALLAAHFLRAGAWVPVFACLALMALLAVPHRAAAVAVQGGLWIGVLEWLRTLATLTAARLDAGLPAARLIAILAAVAVGTALAELALRHPRLAAHYSSSKDSVDGQPDP